MSISTLPLSYCTNVHAGQSLAELGQTLDSYPAAIAAAADGQPLAVGLWLADPVSRELSAEPDGVARLRDRLGALQLSCHTLNAFPFGNFHSKRVKEQVYLPDWSSPQRLEYTLRCAAILAELLPEGREGSISTLPLSFKPAMTHDAFRDDCLSNLIAAAQRLDALHDATGRVIRLAIEPEPFCAIETTPEALALFRDLRVRAAAAGALEVVNEHIGLCYDVCHQAVEFENAAASIQTLRAAGVRINKVHISCAIELPDARNNAAGLAALADYAEPRYLHQTFARTAEGEILRLPDLTRELCENPPPMFRDAETWRVHFHVPVNEDQLGPLRTTRPQLQQALSAVARLDYAPHLEVETYTWAVLPEADRPSLVDGLAAELTATRRLLAAVSPQAAP